MITVKQQAKALGATHFKRAYNGNDSTITSVHFFRPMNERELNHDNAKYCEGLKECAYYVPAMLKFNDGKIKTIDRFNPIDVKQAQPIEEF